MTSNNRQVLVREEPTMKRRFAFLLAAALMAAAPAATATTPADQLVVGMSMNNIVTLDPAAISGRESTGVVTNVYDTLVRLDPIDKTKVHPGLAESWAIGEDGKTITFKLRA